MATLIAIFIFNSDKDSEMLRGFLIWLVKFLLGVAFLGLVFSAATPEITELMKNTFAGIYDRASLESQERIAKVAESFCLSEEDPRQESVISGIERCQDNEMRLALEQDCKAFKSGKKADFEVIKSNEDPGETCKAMEEGSLDKFCSKINQSAMLPDFESMKQACADYSSKKVDGRSLFLAFVGSLFSNLDISKLPGISEYPVLGYMLEMNLIVYTVLVLLLLAILAFLLKDMHVFLIAIASMLFGMSIFLLLPYIGIMAYEHYHGIETDSLFAMVSDEERSTQGPSLEALLGLLMLVMLGIYTKSLLAIAIIFFVIGLIGKIYSFSIRRKTKGSGKNQKKEKNG